MLFTQHSRAQAAVCVHSHLRFAALSYFFCNKKALLFYNNFIVFDYIQNLPLDVMMYLCKKKSRKKRKKRGKKEYGPV